MTKKKLITTAHDFGLSGSVNEGILYAINHKNNIIKEYSLLPNAPYSKQGAEIAKEYKELSVDLCIVLNNYEPLLTNHKTLVGSNGDFIKGDTSTWNFEVLDKFDEKEITREIHAQYEWFLKNVGRKPSALVTQKSEHGDPKILIPLADLAKKENLPIRTPAWKWFTNYAAQSYVEEQGIKHTSKVFVGCYDWKGRFGLDIEKDLDQLFNEAEGISELLIFCGFADEELFKLSSVNWQRGQYLNMLERKNEILLRFKEKFDLISYKEVFV